MSRTKYLSHLERQLDASRRALDDLTRENHELRVLLREAAKSLTHVTSPPPRSQLRG